MSELQPERFRVIAQLRFAGVSFVVFAETNNRASLRKGAHALVILRTPIDPLPPFT